MTDLFGIPFRVNPLIPPGVIVLQGHCPDCNVSPSWACQRCFGSGIVIKIIRMDNHVATEEGK